MSESDARPRGAVGRTAVADRMPVLEVRELSAGYLGIPAVRDLTFAIGAGEVVALLGPNGAGKTTTLSTVAGLLKPLDGQIIFGGDEVGGRSADRLARQGLSLVPEDRALFYDLTARENLRLARHGESMSESDVLQMLPELEKCLGRRAGVLSGGEQQMLSLARGLMSRPRLLLVDEMSLGLAPVIVERLMPVLRRIAEQLHTAVLFVEQHVPQALELADRAYVMAGGSIVMEGTADELRQSRELLEASYLGDADARLTDGTAP
ncbi:MAG TPA: ABC transporter ATP-binding protein [Solirubrobacteraceae bacterium]|jgi:branched-chain amino acid transport system ATP-binding protein|nr:ABC transporter ATP-binding protein [Solirubrobacteraceae bacterium]